MPLQNKIFGPGPDEKEQHNNGSPKNPSKEFRNEDKGAQTSTMDRQGSASPTSSPLHDSSPETNLGNGSAQEQLTDQQQNEHGSSHQADNGEETSSGEVKRNSSVEMANENQPHDPSTSSLPEDNSAPKQWKDKEQDQPVSSQRPQNREESSSEEYENSSSAEVENQRQPQEDPRSSSLREDGEKSSPEETVSNCFA